jgi:hypothetical protein
VPHFSAFCGRTARLFNIARLGREGAFRAAVAARAQWERTRPLRPRKVRRGHTAQERLAIGLRVRQSHAQPAVRARIRAGTRAALAAPGMHEKLSARTKAVWANPEHRAAVVAACRRAALQRWARVRAEKKGSK